jgi:hypothetical protein
VARRPQNAYRSVCAPRWRAHTLLLLLFRFRIDIERIHRLGVRFDEFRHDEYTWNQLLDDVHDGRFGLRSLNNDCFGLRRLLLGRHYPGSRLLRA